MLLSFEDGIEVVGEAGDGVAATELAAATAPDVVLMDVRMPKRSGIEACVAIKLLDEFKQMSRSDRQQVPSPRLTDRELEVLKLVAQGLNNREIAKRLFISENTVKNHVRNILEKLHLHSRMEAVIYAVRERLLDIRSAAD